MARNKVISNHDRQWPIRMDRDPGPVQHGAMDHSTPPTDLDAVRRYRLARVQAQMQRQDVPALLLLDPINYLRGKKSLLRDWQKGIWQSFFCLFFAGLICGLLWEFWNYWAHARWIYQVPYAMSPRIFEMPLLGYLGFPLLAIEYYAFYSMVLGWKR